MQKNFLNWIIILVLSFIVGEVLVTGGQGKYFFYLYIIYKGIKLLELLIILAISSIENHEQFSKKFLDFCKSIFIPFTIFIITLIVSWLITLFFDIHFYIAFQLITLVTCFIPQKKKENND